MHAMRGLEISCFGPFRAALDGVPLTTFESAKVRALLAYLAVESGQPQARSMLADLLWPEQAEDQARRRLSQALYNLRAVLGERALSPVSCLSITSDAILLTLAEDDRVDVVAFSHLMQACDQHSHHVLESCPPCQERLQAAAEFYRGEFLQGFSLRDSAVFEEWILVKREAYRQQARRLFASQLDYHERQDHKQEALSAALRLSDLDPYDESACQAVMRLLAASGRCPEALALYERFANRLQADLDLQPEAQTRFLYDRLRLQKESEPSPPARYTNLPASLSPLIGRETELAEVQRCLLDPACRFLSILGPGGSGKSRLALEAARGLLARFADGVFLIPLSPLVSPDSLLPALAAALRLQIGDKSPPLLQLQDYLRRKELLLVLDGCEDLLESMPLFLELLRAAPYLKLLATSRLRLNLAEEQVYHLGGLQVAADSGLPNVADCPAARLFISGARRTRPGFGMDDASLGAVLAICAELQGMPLAILLAAAWVEILSPAEILAEIRTSLDFLQADWADLPARQRSMRLTFDYSWGLLEEKERLVFQALCVFRGAFTRQAAETVAGVGVTGLRSLAEKSLLMPLPGDRYVVHDLLRQYGLERLNADPNESIRVQRRYSEYYLEQVAEWEAGLIDARHAETLALMTARINDLRSAWNLGSEREDIERMSHDLRGLCLFYEQSNRFMEGKSLCQETVAKLTQSRTPAARLLLVRLLTWESRFQRLLGEVSQAHQTLQEAQALLYDLEAAGLDSRLAQPLVHLEAAEQVFTADLAVARRHLERSLELYCSLGDKWRVGLVFSRLGINRGFSGDFCESNRLLGEAIRLYQSIGYLPGVANARRTMAQNYVRTGNLASGLALMRQVVADSKATGNRAQAAWEQRTLGVVLGWNGLFSEAEPLFLDALIVAEDLDDLYEMTFIKLFLGALALFTGRYEVAHRWISGSLELARQNGFQREAAFCFWVQGGLALAESTPQAARAYYEESIQQYRQVGHKDELSWALALDAFCLLQVGERVKAVQYLQEALELSISIQGYLSSLFSLLVCALWFGQGGNPERSLELYSLIAQQPLFANSTWFKEVFGGRISAYTIGLDAALAEAARQHGAQRQLWDALAEMKALLTT
jgi:DNA-binding SARP family transcriptional activator/predicted ATPase/tetratricopeptide (TPR) repeat protein